jgi:hypothetical protein
MSPLVIAPENHSASNPSPWSFFMVPDDLRELLEMMKT